jgi:hypothetical protein
MKTLYPQLRLTDPSFNYVSAAKTDIRETFRRFSSPQSQDTNKPLVEPTLNLEGFVLPVEWFQVLE